MREKCRKKIETSKLLLRIVLSACAVLAFVTIIATFLLKDTAPLVVLIEKAFLLAQIAVGFYFWKAKAENLHKYKQDDKIGEINEN